MTNTTLQDIDYWKKAFNESDRIVQEIDQLRLKPKANDEDLVRLRRLQEQLADMKESMRPAEPTYRVVMKKYFEEISAGGINVKKSRCAVSEAIRLTPIQRFLKKYFSNENDVSGMLLFHGIGVGKTCTAISIAEEFADRGVRVLVLTKLALMNQFVDEIFDVKKIVVNNGVLDVDSSSMGCTGSTYLRSLTAFDKNGIKHKVESRIKMRYEIDTFHGIVKTINDIKQDVQRIASPGTAAFEVNLDERIREAFSDMLIIIDEIHNLRDSSEDSSKAVSAAVLHVARCAVNMKFLFMTATPMFDSTSDAIWILNLLRINDGLPVIKEEEVFDSGKRTLSASGAVKLADALQGFVSYAPPGTEDDAELYPRVKYVKTSKLYNMYEHQAEGHQLERVKSVPISDNVLAQNVANICFPTPNGFFEEAFETIMDKGNRQRFKYRKNVVEFLSPGKIRSYAAKIASIVEHAKKAEGIVFVYSQLLNTGLVPIAIALEQAGFSRRGPSLLIHDFKETRENNGSYAILCGRNEISDDRKSTLSMLRSKENKHGKEIKVLLGSDVMVEGIDLKNVREVHILEPWWNMNKVKQCVGRAVRRCSHVDLPDSERRVEVYLHSVSDSIDVKKYRVSSGKGDAIAAVEGILKENSIDSCLFDRDGVASTPKCINQDSRGDSQGISIDSQGRGIVLEEYADILLPAIVDNLDENKNGVVELSEVSKAMNAKYFFKSGIDAKVLEDGLHAMLLTNPIDQYVPEIRSFVPYSDSTYMQMRERSLQACMRPSCVKKKLFYDKSSRDEKEEAYHEFSFALLNYVKLQPAAIMESINLQTVRLKTDIRATIYSPSLGEHTVNRLSNAFVDYAIDRLAPSELLCFYAMFFESEGKQNGKSVTDIMTSMKDAGYILADETGACVYGLDYFNNVYYKKSGANERQLEAAEFFEISAFKKKQKEVDFKSSSEKKPIVVRGGMAYVGPNIPYEFKTSKIGFDGGWTRGMVCSSSIMDKDELVDIISSISSSRLKKEDIDKSKASKSLLCIMIELFLRLEGSDSFNRCRPLS